MNEDIKTVVENGLDEVGRTIGNSKKGTILKIGAATTVVVITGLALLFEKIKPKKNYTSCEMTEDNDDNVIEIEVEES